MIRDKGDETNIPPRAKNMQRVSFTIWSQTPPNSPLRLSHGSPQGSPPPGSPPHSNPCSSPQGSPPPRAKTPPPHSPPHTPTGSPTINTQSKQAHPSQPKQKPQPFQSSSFSSTTSSGTGSPIRSTSPKETAHGPVASPTWGKTTSEITIALPLKTLNLSRKLHLHQNPQCVHALKLSNLPLHPPTDNGQTDPELSIYGSLNVIDFESLLPGEDVDATVIDVYRFHLSLSLDST